MPRIIPFWVHPRVTSPLKLLFEAIGQAHTEHDLRSQVVPTIGEYFAAKRRGLFSLISCRKQIATFRKYWKLGYLLNIIRLHVT